ncbi:MAG: hypothetical protein A3F46_08080 [Legionellales bacterium RIFCSPHIGHO2_12_FULL_42_9]|nr:MAG: hypothetical protein A3F46_08080 [Legionellales bacterium RIFCSPHIGHO2_12_FULL_42_9]
MKLLVIVLCLLSERYLTHKVALDRFSWFGKYCDKLLAVIPKNRFLQHPLLLMLVVILPWIGIIALAIGLLKSYLFGFVGFLMQLVVFYYCLGPDNAFYPLSAPKKKNAHQALDAGNYLAVVNNQLFGVIFWYLALGPLAVLAYRLFSLCQKQSKLAAKAKWITSLLDWIPARLTVIFYLLVGNFQQGFKYLLQKKLIAPSENNTLLTEVGLLAVRAQTDEQLSLPAAQGLVEYALILSLVFVAIFTLVSWL